MSKRINQMSNIANAIGFVDVVMRTSDVEGLSHYDLIVNGIKQSQLSYRDAIGIIRESVRHTNLPNSQAILREIETVEFWTYLVDKFQISHRLCA